MPISVRFRLNWLVNFLKRIATSNLKSCLYLIDSTDCTMEPWWLLGGASLCMLGIVYASVSNVMMARVLGKSSEFALKMSLGATKLQVFRETAPGIGSSCAGGNVYWSGDKLSPGRFAPAFWASRRFPFPQRRCWWSANRGCCRRSTGIPLSLSLFSLF
jgi:hypothetical protein